MHPLLSRAFQGHREHDPEAFCFSRSHNYKTKQNKLPSFIDRSRLLIVMANHSNTIFFLLGFVETNCMMCIFRGSKFKPVLGGSHIFVRIDQFWFCT